MYSWLERQLDEQPVAEKKTLEVKKWRLLNDYTRIYSDFTQMLCLAAFDRANKTVLTLWTNEEPSEELIQSALLHFKNVQMIYENNILIKIQLRELRASSIQHIFQRPINPLVEQLFGRTPRIITRSREKMKVYKVKKEAIKPLENRAYDRLLQQLKRYKLQTFPTRIQLNEAYQQSEPIRFFTTATNEVMLTVNDENYIHQFTFK